MSPSTWPGPTDGSWSTSPTRISAARGGTARSSACISGTSTIDVSSTTSRSHVERVRARRAGSRRAPDRPRAAGGSSSPRGRCSPTAAWPRGRSARRARAWTPLARRISRIAFTSVVLPTPGPPVMTRTFERSASRIASRWLSASVMPALRLDPRHGLLGVDRRPGQAAGAEAAQASRRSRARRGAARPGRRSARRRRCPRPPRPRPARAPAPPRRSRPGPRAASRPSAAASRRGRPQWPSSIASVSA